MPLPEAAPRRAKPKEGPSNADRRYAAHSGRCGDGPHPHRRECSGGRLPTPAISVVRSGLCSACARSRHVDRIAASPCRRSPSSRREHDLPRPQLRREADPMPAPCHMEGCGFEEDAVRLLGTPTISRWKRPPLVVSVRRGTSGKRYIRAGRTPRCSLPDAPATAEFS